MDAAVGLDVGRKAADLPGREPNPIIFAMRGSAEFKAWLQEAADHCNLSVSGFITQAVRDYAKRQRFEKPQPRR